MAECKNNNSSSHSPSPPPPPLSHTKRRRRPAGTPDPDAEVMSLSPRTLLESDQHVCDICNRGFQREQNLQMHRRRHKVPWKLVKRETSPQPVTRKRVFVCPEPSCLHHNPLHALGDLVGIKKHFRRKHSNSRQWVCHKCFKAYAVQSDFKAHLKTCGTRGHSCDCGRVFSRVESFIEHQDECRMVKWGRGEEEESLEVEVVREERWWCKGEDSSPHLELSIGCCGGREEEEEEEEGWKVERGRMKATKAMKRMREEGGVGKGMYGKGKKLLLKL